MKTTSWTYSKYNDKKFGRRSPMQVIFYFFANLDCIPIRLYKQITADYHTAKNVTPMTERVRTNRLIEELRT